MPYLSIGVLNSRGGGRILADQAAIRPIIISKLQEQIKINY